MTAVIKKATKEYKGWCWPHKDRLGYSCSNGFWVDGYVSATVKYSNDWSSGNMNLDATPTTIRDFDTYIDDENIAPYIHTGNRNQYNSDYNCWANTIIQNMFTGGDWLHFAWNRLESPKDICFVMAGVYSQVDLNIVIETVAKLPNVKGLYIDLCAYEPQTGEYHITDLESDSLEYLYISQNYQNVITYNKLVGLASVNCPNLISLELHGGQDYNDRNYISPATLANFPNLKLFSTTTTWCYCKGDLRQYCLAMPNIEYFCINGSSWNYINNNGEDVLNYGLYGDVRAINFCRKLKKFLLLGICSSVDPVNMLNYLNGTWTANVADANMDAIRTWTRSNATDDYVADWSTTNCQISTSWFSSVPNIYF